METAKQIDYRAMIQVRACFHERRLTKQQYRTLRGKILAGDSEAAMKGLRTILNRRKKKHESVCDRPGKH